LRAAVVLGSELPRRTASALVTENRGGVCAGLLQEIVGQGERRMEILSTMALRKIGRRF